MLVFWYEKQGQRNGRQGFIENDPLALNMVRVHNRFQKPFAKEPHMAD